MAAHFLCALQLNVVQLINLPKFIPWAILFCIATGNLKKYWKCIEIFVNAIEYFESFFQCNINILGNNTVFQYLYNKTLRPWLDLGLVNIMWIEPEPAF